MIGRERKIVDLLHSASEVGMRSILALHSSGILIDGAADHIMTGKMEPAVMDNSKQKERHDVGVAL